jgi:hypothetical protein
MVTEAEWSGEDSGGGGGASPASPDLVATDRVDVVLDTGRRRVSWGFVGSYSFMMAVLSHR